MRLRNGTFLTLLLGCLCALFSLSWYGAFGGHKGKDPARPRGKGGACSPGALRRAPVRGRGPPARPRSQRSGRGPQNALRGSAVALRTNPHPVSLHQRKILSRIPWHLELTPSWLSLLPDCRRQAEICFSMEGGRAYICLFLQRLGFFCCRKW